MSGVGGHRRCRHRASLAAVAGLLLASVPAAAQDRGLPLPSLPLGGTFSAGPGLWPALTGVTGKPGCYRKGAYFKLRGRNLGSGSGLQVAVDFDPPGGKRPGPRHRHMKVLSWRAGAIAVEALAPPPAGAAAAWIGIERRGAGGHGDWRLAPLEVPVCAAASGGKPSTSGGKGAFAGSPSPVQGSGRIVVTAPPPPDDGGQPPFDIAGFGGEPTGEWGGDDGGSWEDDGGWWADGDDAAGAGPSPGSLSGGLLAKALPEPPPSPAEAAREDEDLEPGEILLASASVEDAARLAEMLQPEGFRLRRRRVLRGLGMVLSTFRVPEGVTARQAIERLRQRYPDLWLDGNHRYRPMGLEGAAQAVRYARALVGWHDGPGCGRGLVIGLADGPVDARHPALAGRDVASLRLVGPAFRPAPPSHGTALAGLLVGAPESGFDGLLPEAALRVAVVLRSREGGRRVDTTAELVVRALDAFVGAGAQAAVLSLGGPPNRLLELAVRLAEERGLALAAAAGNGGREQAVYPAAYPQVLGVTAVDADARPFREADRGAHVALAAPGVDLWVAAPGASGRYATGTSYAVPFAAAALALERGRGADPPTARARLLERARDLGEPGPDPRFGHGLLRHPGCAGA